MTVTATCALSTSGMKVPPIRGKSSMAATKLAAAIPRVMNRWLSAQPIKRRYCLPIPTNP
ncbi:MAG: hypothetical protein IPK72_06465 [Candidatus Eisenbacteria bacterium]|nr:hypothetical protein [Candidatus Eisenbacteria bacterium]